MHCGPSIWLPLIIRSRVTKGVSLQASMGPTLSGGVAYLVTGSGSATDQVYPNSIVALSGKELTVKDWYTPAGDARQSSKPQSGGIYF